MKKKLLSIALCAAMASTLLVGCQSAAQSASSTAATASKATSTASTGTASAAATAAPAEETPPAAVAKDKVKVGFIYVGDNTDHGYTSNFMDGTAEMKKDLGLTDDQVIEKTNIGEDSTCETALKELAEAGCNIIFATSFGFEDYVEQVAPNYPDVQFCHATGYQCASDQNGNTHNYFPQIYEARYLTGIIAGLKTKTNKIGYVAAMPYSEVISGYTAFYLGAKSVNPKVTMEVQYTNKWNDANLESQLAQAMIDDGCDVLGQHADSAATATVCEKAGVWQIGYNSDMRDKAPNASICSCRCDWGKYAEYAVQSVIDGKAIPQDWTAGLNDDAVVVTPYNDTLMPEGAADKVETAKAAIKGGTLHVFDVSTFTVGGKAISSAKSAAGTELIADGYLHEQEIGYGGSSPAWPSDDIIDGITVKQ